MNQLTTKQQRALKSIGTTHQAARYLDAHPTTLTSLVRMTLADRQYDTTNRRWTYRITSTGATVLRQIRQDEENAPAATVEDRIRDTYESLSAKRGRDILNQQTILNISDRVQWNDGDHPVNFVREGEIFEFIPGGFVQVNYREGTARRSCTIRRDRLTKV